MSYLTFTSEEANSKVVINNLDFRPGKLRYRINGNERWFDVPYILPWTIELPKVGDFIEISGYDVVVGQGYYDRPPLLMEGKIKASGDVTSLVNWAGGNEVLRDYAFTHLFYDCGALTSVPKLPSKILSMGCYSEMFFKCTGITSIPDNLLPAVELAESCYRGMFANCVRLMELPLNLLPAMTVPEMAYASMFSGCTCLTTLTKLPARWLGDACYDSMFAGCVSLQGYIRPMSENDIKIVFPATIKFAWNNQTFEGIYSKSTVPPIPASGVPYYFKGKILEKPKMTFSGRRFF